MRLDTSSMILFGFDIKKLANLWLSGLAQIFPASLRDYFLKPAQYILIKTNREVLSFFYVNGTTVNYLLDSKIDIEKRSLSDLLRNVVPESVKLSEIDIVLCVPNELCLRKVVRVPRVVQHTVREAIRFQLSRITPYTAESLWFDAKVLDATSNSDFLNVDVIAVPKEHLAHIESSLFDYLGISVNRASVFDAENKLEEFNLFWEKSKKTKILKRLNINFYAILLIFFLALSIGVAPVVKKRMLVVEQKRSLLVLEGQISELKNKKIALDKQLGIIDFLYDQRRAALSTASLISELTRIIPKDVYFSGLLVKGDMVEVSGSGRDVVRLIDIINSSSHFQQARFIAPLSRDSRTDLDQFKISFLVVKRNSGVE